MINLTISYTSVISNCFFFLLLIILERVEGKGRFVIKRIRFTINGTKEKQWKSTKLCSVKP